MPRPPYPVTPDGRYFVVRGRLWRMTNPDNTKKNVRACPMKSMRVEASTSGAKWIEHMLSSLPGAALPQQLDEQRHGGARVSVGSSRVSSPSSLEDPITLRSGIRAGDARVRSDQDREPANRRALGRSEPNRPIVCYCASGMRSAKAAEILSHLGYTRAYNLGGFSAWVAAGGATERG